MVYLKLLWNISYDISYLKEIRYVGSNQISHRTQYLTRYLTIYADIWNWIWHPKSNNYISIYCIKYGCVLKFLRKNKICWKSTIYLNTSQDISMYHVAQRHIVRVAVAGQSSGWDSRLSLIPALTRSHGQPEAADSEPEPWSESEPLGSHGHDHRGSVTVRPG